MSRARRKKVRPPSRDQAPQGGRATAVNLLLVGVLVLAGVAAYHNSFGGVFVFDDHRHIVSNESIRHLSPVWEHLVGRRRPVARLSLAVNYACGELRVWGYHAFNLAVHLLAGLALFGVVRRTVIARAESQHGHASVAMPPRVPQPLCPSSAAPWLALAVALVWIVHPLNSQAVTYTIQRCESLMGLFYLLAIYCVIRGVGSSRGWVWFAGAVVAGGLSMGSKAVAVSLPVVVLLYDRTFLSASFAETFRKRWALYLGLAATWSILVFCGVTRGVLHPAAGASATVGFGYKGVTPWEYALTQPGVILHYLWLAFWPHPLCLDYDWPVARAVLAVVPQGLAILALLVGTVWGLVRRSWWGFAGAWFFLILAPTSSFIPIKDLAFEHRMYLPLAAVITVVVGGAFVAVTRLAGADARRFRRLGVAGGGLTLVAAVLLGCTTVQRNEDYHSPAEMWGSVLAVCPENARARYGLARALAMAGDDDGAIEQYREAVAIQPDYAEAYNNLGSALERKGDLDGAVACYRAALAHQSDLYRSHYNLGIVLTAQGKLDEAIEHYRKALEIKPDNAEAHNNLGSVLSRRGDVSGAIECFRTALRYQEDLYNAHYNLAAGLANLGAYDEAVEHFRQAVRWKPDHVIAHLGLGKVLEKQGRLGEAVKCYQEAVRLDPANRDAQQRLKEARARLDERGGS